MNDTTIPTGSNVDLLLEHLKENSLARDLVTTYRDTAPTDVSGALKNVLEERLKDARQTIDHAED